MAGKVIATYGLRVTLRERERIAAGKPLTNSEMQTAVLNALREVLPAVEVRVTSQRTDR